MIQVYTGNGKGKTTAALGLALRASGAGHKVYICQFLKGKDYCELHSLKKFKNIKVEQFGSKCFIRHLPREEDIKLAQAGLVAAKKAIRDKSYSLIVLDEINIALKLKLVDLKDVLSLLKSLPKKTELILTGRYAHPDIIKLADLVSEIRERKHYFKKGLRARKGIEF
ncbi:MAG: cob(I)yrinic acid a,c-diamide adenosyltransferase [Candidatus Omnitrophica bacterium]|nr:cob(I)yrinic acid a,c-diamide adenosyltransferase [Candidatus Omnitrophota bacterium]